MQTNVTLSRSSALLSICYVALKLSTEVLASGIYRNGYGARSAGLAGADVSFARSPISAIAINPAGLATRETNAFELSVMAARADGDVQNRAGVSGELQSDYGAIPDAAVAYRPETIPVTFGFGIVPDALLSADWRYTDVPGGLTGQTTYGRRQHHAEINVIRSALGAGISLSPKLSVGGSIGLVYNRNVLQAPYIFQVHPVLRGFKTLLDLETDGLGYNGQVGLLFRPHEDWQFGISYTTDTTIRSHGDASGDASAQLQSLGGGFVSVRPDFEYDAEVRNTFPEIIATGLSWQAHPRLRLITQIDWLNWSESFDKLRIKLTDGSNADINAFVGSSTLEDAVPLNWSSRFVYRTGAEYALASSMFLRAGYSYGRSPVPSDTLSPLTAAILEHALAAGFSYEWDRYTWNVGYQYNLPQERTVARSKLLAGEYSDSEVNVGIHWIGLSAEILF